MTSRPNEFQSPARAARMIHASLILGQVLFAGVAVFTKRANAATVTALPRTTVLLLFGAAIAACIIALVLRQQVPARSSSTSPDAFWTTASQKATLTWAPLEAAGLFALSQYFMSVDAIALAAAAIPLTLLVILNPWHLERQ